MNIVCVYSLEDFVYVEKALPSFAYVHFGISYIATSLKNAGHNPMMLVFTSQTNIMGTLRAHINKHQPRLFCLTAVSSQYHLICDIGRVIKEIDPSIYIILGGHHATLNPDSTIREQCFDAICVGEGEKAVVAAAHRIERNEQPAGINNLWIKKGSSGSIEKNPREYFIQNLDSLPIIDRSMWDEWVVDKNRLFSVLVGRGCPFNCTYCSNHALAKISPGKYVRFRSPENVITELHEIVTHYPAVRTIHLEVETLGANLEYAYALCNQLEGFNADRPTPVNFSVNFAVTKNVINDHENLLKALKRANVDYINIGLESGSERVRTKILRRPRYSNEEIVAFSRAAALHGIDINLFVLMGIPGETVADFKDTIACVRQCDPQYVYLSVFYPFPGTDLYRKAKEMKIFDDDIVDPVAERRKASLDLPGFSKKQIQREYYLFPYYAFRGKKPLYKIIASIIRGYIYAQPGLNALYMRLVHHHMLKRLHVKLLGAFRN